MRVTQAIISGCSGDMSAGRWLLWFLTSTSLILQCIGANDAQGWNQVKGLQRAMYAQMKYSRACVKLLTASGPQGCEAPGGKVITAPLVHSKDLGVAFNGPRVVVVPAAEADGVLSQILADAGLRSNVAGVLVDPTTGRPARHSTGPKFPSAAYAPYNNASYVWNPAGTGFNRAWFGLPIFMLTAEVAADTAWRATYNAVNEFKGGRHVARMDLTMQAEGDSVRCITDQTCLPVGSYGVWTALPLLPDPAYRNATARSITLVLAQMDSNAMFHDLAKGAGTSMSGLIAALVAVTLLAQSDAPATYSRQLVFAALPGEGFDYLGSKRMLYEMDRNTSYVQGLRMELVDQIVEVGQVGTAWDPTSNTSTFYMHTQPGSAADLVAAVQAAAVDEAARVRAQAASRSNPGLPPSSLSSFLRVKPSVAGLVLADFDSAFRNPFYQSEWDDGSNVTAIVDASLLLTRTLHSLAAGPSTPPLQPNRTTATQLVAALVSCLILEIPGLDCPLVRGLMKPDVQVFYDGTSSSAVGAYPGVLSWVASDPRTSYYKPNLPRFLFNYLGNLTAAPLPNTTATAKATANSSNAEGALCDPNINVCPAPYSCIGWRHSQDVSGMGRCRNTTTNYVPAYSTRMVYSQVGSSWRWWINDSAVAWDVQYGWPNDSMWTESNWPEETLIVTVFQEESYTTQVVTLVVGLVLTFGTAAVSWLGVKAFERHQKQH